MGLQVFPDLPLATTCTSAVTNLNHAFHGPCCCPGQPHATPPGPSLGYPSPLEGLCLGAMCLAATVTSKPPLQVPFIRVCAPGRLLCSLLHCSWPQLCVWAVDYSASLLFPGMPAFKVLLPGNKDMSSLLCVLRPEGPAVVT